MSGILCAIRGGPASQGPIEQSITLAKETGEALHFLYVVNLDFLKMTEISRTHVISEEMHHMGEFILLTAQAQAQKAGVSAVGTVRHGDVTQEIIDLANELGASHIVLGRPLSEDQTAVFSDDRLEAFVNLCEQETSARVVLASSGGEA